MTLAICVAKVIKPSSGVLVGGVIEPERQVETLGTLLTSKVIYVWSKCFCKRVRRSKITVEYICAML